MKSSRYPNKHVKDLDYADDIDLLVNQINNAETLLSTLETAARQREIRTVNGTYISNRKNDFNICKTLVWSV